MVAYLWPLTVWERFNAWLFTLTLVLALLLTSVFSHSHDLRSILCTLVPQVLYVGLCIDSLYIVGTTAADDVHALRTVTRRGMAFRVCSSVLVAFVNMVLFVALLVEAATGIYGGDGIHSFWQAQSGAFIALVCVVATLLTIPLLQLACVYMGSPFSADARRRLQYMTE